MSTKGSRLKSATQRGRPYLSRGRRKRGGRTVSNLLTTTEKGKSQLHKKKNGTVRCREKRRNRFHGREKATILAWGPPNNGEKKGKGESLPERKRGRGEIDAQEKIHETTLTKT